MLERIADARGGAPFDASSLTEDYELGLTIAAMGGEVRLARVTERRGGPKVAVHAYFPATFRAAIRQKARWMTGIALAGWDRTGWARPLALGDHWMRMRDRRATLAIPVLATAYFALIASVASMVVHAAIGIPAPGIEHWAATLLGINLILLGWRLLVRAMFVQRVYGWSEAFWSVPRIIVSNFIALFAAGKALHMYVRLLSGAAPRWAKTDHHFPDSEHLAA